MSWSAADSVGAKLQETKPTLRDLTGALKEVADWETLGVRLGVSASKSDEIARNRSYRDPHLCKKDLLNHWLENDADPTWEKVAIALEEMDMRNAARKIRTAYCS